MRTFVSLALFGVTALNLFKNTVFPPLIAIASLFITLAVTMGSAQAGSTTLSLSTVLTAVNPAITDRSATSITIESDKLTRATDNLVEFRVTVSSDRDHPIRGVEQSSDAPKDSRASKSTISPPTNFAELTYIIPVDQVPFGSSPVTFTYQVKSFVTPSGENTVTNCEDASALAMYDPGQFRCDDKMLSVTVNPISPPDTGNLTAALTSNFLRRRIRNTLNAEPGLSDQLNNDGGESVAPVGYGFAQNGNSFDVNLSGNKSFGFAYGAEEEERFNLWFKSSIARITEAGVKQKFSVGHVGLGYKVNSDLVVGALAQFDNAKEVDGVATVKGTGWLVGPYLAANVHEKLLFEGRVALGASSNKISPLGTYTDKFTTRRFLARGKISGHFQQGEWKVAPNFAVQYMRENRAAYVDNVGTTIPSSTISLGQFVFGTDFSTAFETENGTTISPSVGFKGLWNFADTGFFDPATGLISSTEAGDVSARFDAGVLFDNNDGLTLSLNGFYDGIGAKNYEGFGGTAKFLIKF